MAHKPIILFFYLFIVICTIISCRSLEASFPDLEKVELKEFSAKESVMNIKLQVNMAPMLEFVEKSTAKSFKGTKNTCEGVSYDYHFSRDPIQFGTSKKEVNYTINGDFSLELNYCPLCVTLFGLSSCTIPRVYGSCGIGEPRRRYTMTYGTSIALNKDYSLNSKTRLKDFKIKDPCKITFVNYDVTGKVKKEITTELKAMEKSIDEQISQIDLKPKIDSLWRELRKPVEIESYGFLNLNPRRITISSLQYQNMNAYFSLNLFFSPFLSTQKVNVNQELLDEMPSHKEVDGFDITADIKADYDSLSSVLTKEFHNYEFLVKGKPFIIKELSIIGTNSGKLVFRVVFDGFRKGTLYLIGTPEIDGINQVLSFNDIDFEFKTKSLLLKSSEWLLSKSVIQEIQQKAKIDLSENLNTIKGNLKDKLTGELIDGVHSESNIKELKVLKLLLSSDSIAIRTSITGDLKITID